MSIPSITYIGRTNYRNSNTRFGIKDNDRSNHIYCLGKTGSGKSTLLLNMALSDVQRGNGICLIDPHGDIAEEILNYIPIQRVCDVIYFNPAERNYLIAFNPLKADAPKHIIASGVVSTLKKVWSDNWGPRLEHILRNTILTLLYYPPATLLDVQPMLTDEQFRFDVLGYVDDRVLLSFWHKEFNPLSASVKSEIISPILNKIGLFASHPVLRSILGQAQSSFHIADVMDDRKILICNLSKGSLGEEATHLLGSLLVTQFQTAALGRSERPLVKRTPFYIYIDEMHSFITLSFADILAEARKYGLSLFLAHQYIDQLDEEIRNAVLGNVGTLISFRIGAQDAALLEQELYPVFTKEDLINLPRYHIYLKLMIDGTTSRPFSAETMPLQFAATKSKAEIITLSRSRYKMPKIPATFRPQPDHSAGALFG